MYSRKKQTKDILIYVLLMAMGIAMTVISTYNIDGSQEKLKILAQFGMVVTTVSGAFIIFLLSHR